MNIRFHSIEGAQEPRDKTTDSFEGMNPGQLLVWFISRGPRLTTLQGHPVHVGCLEGAIRRNKTPLRQDLRLKQPPVSAAFRPHPKDAAAAGREPVPSRPCDQSRQSAQITDIFKSIESNLHDGYYTTGGALKRTVPGFSCSC